MQSQTRIIYKAKDHRGAQRYSSRPTRPHRNIPRELTATTALQDPMKERSLEMARQQTFIMMFLICLNVIKGSPYSLVSRKTQERTSHLVLSIRGDRWREDIMVTWVQAPAADENNEETYLHCCQSKESHQNGAKQLQN